MPLLIRFRPLCQPPSEGRSMMSRAGMPRRDSLREINEGLNSFLACLQSLTVRLQARAIVHSWRLALRRWCIPHRWLQSRVAR
jgi:hypothetical protein